MSRAKLHFEVLGIHDFVDDARLEQAYTRHAAQANRAGDEDLLQEVWIAREILSNRDNRARYKVFLENAEHDDVFDHGLTPPSAKDITYTVLKLDEATIQFGGLIAVNKVSFELEKGVLFGLIGPNGAGKTTCFNLITGVYTPTGGDIFFQGERINGQQPHKIAKRGICRTFQNIRLFKALTAVENVMIGGFLRQKTNLLSALTFMPWAVNENAELRMKAMELLEVMDLADIAESRAADLPYGKQRRLEIARAMASQPDLILLDEPAAGMNPQEKEALQTTVRRIRDDFDKTVLLIEHDMRFVMGLCEKIVVLDHGEEIARGEPSDIQNNPKVIEAYLGEPVDAS